MKIKCISIESEHDGPVIGRTHQVNDNTDVWVEMEDGEQLDQTTIETVIQDLIDQGLFRIVFRKLQPDRWVWLFHGAGGRFAGGAFTDLADAEQWIRQHRLSGTLTRYPLNQGVFNWAVENNRSNLKPETLAAKANNPAFIGSFTTASMEHYHYEAGEKG